jgi:hypothetical protein
MAHTASLIPARLTYSHRTAQWSVNCPALGGRGGYSLSPPPPLARLAAQQIGVRLVHLAGFFIHDRLLVACARTLF